MKALIWEELTEEELYNVILEDFVKHVKTDADYIIWAKKIVENLCLMMSKVSTFIPYLDPKKTPRLVLPEKDYDLKSINKNWQGEAKTMLKKLWN
jgi:hypothetical protein